MTSVRFRNVRKKEYTQIGNDLLWNKELTLQAKGLLTIFLSNSDDWETNMKEIITRSKNGRDAHYTIVKELIEKGYFARIEVRTKKGFESMQYLFSDIPKDIKDELINIEKTLPKEKEVYIEYENRSDKLKKEVLNNDALNSIDTVLTESQDAEIQDAESQYINNTNLDNTNLNKTNKDQEEELSNAREKNLPYQVLSDFLNAKGIDQQTTDKTIKELINKNISTFSVTDFLNQFSYMMEKIENGETDNHNGFAVYFANGIQMRSTQSNANKQHKEEQTKEYERIMKRKEENKNVYFNWLEESL